MPCCEISDCAQMSKTIIAVKHFGLGGRESLETAVMNGNKAKQMLLTTSQMSEAHNLGEFTPTLSVGGQAVEKVKTFLKALGNLD